LKIDPCQQRMVVGAEDACTPVTRVLVEPVHPGLGNGATPIAHQEIVQH
jgi:hypothetical protein